MRKMSFRLLLLASFATAIFSCQKEETISEEVNLSEKQYPGVDPALWPFFRSFEKEGAIRGLNIDLKSIEITGVIEELEEEGVAGQCSYASHQPNHIVIDRQFWLNSSDLYKEFVVFHEIGHCFLLRDHREDQYDDGTCVSLMRSGLGACRDNYNPSNRTVYLDELFNPQLF